MTTMNISLPDALKAFVDEQVAQRGYGTSSEYVRELIRKDRDRQHLRALILEGAESPIVGEADGAYFKELRNRVAKGNRKKAARQ
jgi:antitoxin ParD1/3/4